jgi:ABC-type bacteriocin/lantibiotic exporter with double-glycine peptidase domain
MTATNDEGAAAVRPPLFRPEVAERNCTRVLFLLAGAFAVVALFRLVTEVARGMLLVYIQSQLDLSMAARACCSP